MPEDIIRQRLAELARGRDHEFLASQIFADQLNYPVALAPLPRQKWNPDIARTVRDSQVLNAAGDFKIIYCQTEDLRRGIQRPIIHEILKYNVPSQYFLTVFSDRAGTSWDFISPKVQPSKTAPLLRFLPVRNDGRHRTATEILLRTEFKRGMSPIQLQSLFDLAFDKEQVTDAFFEDFRRTFAALAKEIEDHNNGVDAAQAETLAQESLDRLLFLYFIQRKGWLNGDPDYLPNRYVAFRSDQQATTFYTKFLFRLFQKLSTSPGREFTATDLGVIPFLNGGLFDFDPLAGDTETTIWTRLKIRNKFFEEIFDAHDGLFEKYNFTVREDTPLDTTVAVDPEMLGRIFESLVLKMEKGEDLRKKTGSFYTPRVIVHSMCQEALLHYLLGKLGGDRADWKRKLETLLAINAADGVDGDEEKLLNQTISVEEAKALRKLVLACRVCDPAVGSGAFPIGMLHEMVNVVRLYDARIHGPKVLEKRNYDYQLKRQIIEDCLYGVDIQEKAVRICEVRLWLSLVVDYDLGIDAEAASPTELASAIKGIPALPNLTYHIRSGDSLIEKLFGHPVWLKDLSKHDDELIARIVADKQRHYDERELDQKRRIELTVLVHYCELAQRMIERRKKGFKGIQKGMFDESKAECEERERLEAELAEYERIEKHSKLVGQRIVAVLNKKRLPEREYESLRREFQGNIVWRLDFAEVFASKGGFDVAIANPPYINMIQADKTVGLRDELRRRFVTAKGAFDVFVPFYELSYSVTTAGGCVSLITPNKLLSAEYATALREFIYTNARLVSLLDAAQCHLFDAAVYPITLLFVREKPTSDVMFITRKAVRNGREISIHEHGSFNQTILEKFPEGIWSPALEAGVEVLTNAISSTRTFGDVCTIRQAASVDEAYKVFKPLLTEAGSRKAQTHKPFLISGIIDRYSVYWGKRAISYLRSRFREPVLKLDPKRLSAERMHQINSPKVIVSGQSLHPKAFFDHDAEYASGIPTVLLYDASVQLGYLCGVLNSRLIRELYRIYWGALAMSGGYMRFGPPQIRRMPLPETTDEQADHIASLVKTVQAEYRKASPNLKRISTAEEEIDQIVFKAFEVSPAAFNSAFPLLRE